jgi:hypothetical protein
MIRLAQKLSGFLVLGVVYTSAGCVTLTVDQSTFQGDPARSEGNKLAVAKGIARSIQAHTKLWGEQNEKFGPEIENIEKMAEQAGKNKLGQEALLRRNLYQFATEVEMTRSEPSGSQGTGKPIQPWQSVHQDHEDAQRIKEIIRFPAFDQIAIDEKYWKRINPIEVFGGFGKSEFVLVRDDGGNYNIKSAAFDPTEVVAAGVNSALSVMRIIATAYGFPALPVSSAPHAQGTPYPLSGLSTPNLSTYVEHSQRTVSQLDSSARRLKEDISRIQSSLSGTVAAATLATAIEAAKSAASRYVRMAGVSSRNVDGLQSLARLLPENDPRERLALQFEVGAVSPRQTVALYWVYRIGLVSEREKQLVEGLLKDLVTFTNLNPAKKLGQNIGIVSDALAEIDRAKGLGALVNDTRENLVKLDGGWKGLTDLHADYESRYQGLKQVVDLFVNLDTKNGGKVTEAWGKALELLKQHPASQVQGSADSLTAHFEVVKNLGDNASSKAAEQFYVPLSQEFRKMVGVTQILTKLSSKASLTDEEAQEIQKQVTKEGDLSAQLKLNRLPELPGLKEILDFNG